MNRQKKYSLIPVLMLISQLLLTLFVIQWLVTQFRDEKKQLEKDLNTFYIAAGEEVLDTLIFTKYINPVMESGKVIISDSGQVKISGLPTDSAGTAVNVFAINRKHKTSGNTGHGVMEIRVKRENDSLSLPPAPKKRVLVNEDLLIRSMKLIVAHSTSDTAGEGPRTITMMINPDSALFKKQFSERIKDAGINISLDWETDSVSNTGKTPGRYIFINPETPFSLPEAVINKYNGYLLGKIFPQISFGLLLVIITALAFFLSYRGIRYHIVLDGLRNEFINNMTHELKTPVSTIGVALEALKKYNMKDDRKMTDEYLSIATAETKRLGDLVSKVLDQSLLGENGHLLNISEFNPDELISEVISITGNSVPDGGTLKHNRNLQEIMIRADKLLLKGVLINLIDNSLKYCDKIPEVNISCTSDERSVIISVSDNGPGIPEEYHRRIFEKFFRLPSSTHNVKGYGLGLSFASMVVKLHGGIIDVKNTDPGAAFTIKLPLNG